MGYSVTSARFRFVNDFVRFWFSLRNQLEIVF